MAAQETEAQKRERQSKALGAAFLAHQVSELEHKVDTLTFSRDPRLYNAGGRGGRGGGRGGAANGASGGARQRKREIRVVDASVLVHALPVLKRWVREDTCQLVVPLSALSTLDLLKKAPPSLADASRQATLFLETQFNIARQLSAAFPPAEADARIRLRPQKEGEEMSWAEVEKAWKVPEGWEVELPEGVERPPPEVEGEEPPPLPLPTANDIPRHLRSTLQCALYFQQKAVAASSSPSSSSSNSATKPPPPPLSSGPVTLVYTSLLPTPPPLHSSLLKLIHSHNTTKLLTSSPRKPARDTLPPPDFLALSSGDALTYYLSTFFSLSPSFFPRAEEEGVVHLISSSEVVAAQQWLKGQAQAMQAAREREVGFAGGGGGRGGGGGGRGGGGRGRGGRGGGGGRGGRGGGAGQGGQGGESGGKTLFVP